MELLGGRPVWSMSGGELLTTLDDVDAEIARLGSYRLRLVGAVESTGYAADLGARDTAELLRFRYNLDASTARRTLRLAQALPKYPSVSAALDETAALSPAAEDVPDDETAGGVGGGWLLRPAQADAIVSSLERVPAHVPVEDRDAAERELVGLAAHLPPSELRAAGNKMRDILDTDGPEPEEAKASARESLTLTAADRGVKFRGYLANENAELLRAVIHAGARPHKTIDGEHDPRPRDKRQADALSTALTIAAASTDAAGSLRTDGNSHSARNHPVDNTLSEPTASEASGRLGEVVPGFGAKAQLTVTIDFRDLQAATADACGQLVYGDGLSAATVRRLACDAKVIPLVLGTKSEPLDVGRSKRLVTRDMRRALNARDRGCVVCGAPPVMCDAHHLVSWIDGGATAVDNLALLCRRHHVDVHHEHWTVTITNGTVHVTRPRWAVSPPTKRHRPHPPAAPHPANTPALQQPAPHPAARTAAQQPAALAGAGAAAQQPAAQRAAGAAAQQPAAQRAAGAAAQQPAAQPAAHGAAQQPAAPAGARADAQQPAARPDAQQPAARPAAQPAACAANWTAPPEGVTSAAGPSASRGTGGHAVGAGLDSLLELGGLEPVVSVGLRSRWTADEETHQAAAEFALTDVSVN